MGQCMADIWHFTLVPHYYMYTTKKEDVFINSSLDNLSCMCLLAEMLSHGLLECAQNLSALTIKVTCTQAAITLKPKYIYSILDL